MFKKCFALMLALCLLLSSASMAYMETADSDVLSPETVEDVLLPADESVEEVVEDFGAADETAESDGDAVPKADEGIQGGESDEELSIEAILPSEVVTDDASDLVYSESPVMVEESADEADKAVTAEAGTTFEAAPAGSKPAKVAFTLNGSPVSGTLTIKKNDTLTLVPVATTASGAVIGDIGFKWKSSKKKVASCAGGVIRGKAIGTTKVTVTTKRGKKKATIKIKVIDPYRATKVELNEGYAKLFKGSQLQLVATLTPSYSNSTVKWSSSNKSVARVSSSGLVTARKIGKAVITCKTSSGKKARVTVKVIKKGGPATALNWDVSPDEFVYRNTIGTYVAKTTPLKANANLVWSSNNENVLRVVNYARSGDLSFWGDVQGVSIGTATLTATDTVTGKSISIAVPVQDPPAPQSIDLPMGSVITVTRGSTMDVPYEVLPSTSLGSEYNRASVAYDSNIASITYDSNNAARNCKGTSDYNLHVTGLNPGSTTVTITLGNGVSASFTLVVV